MKKRTLGRSGLEVSALGFACMGLLTADDLRQIESAASKITVQGDRYPEHLSRLTDR